MVVGSIGLAGMVVKEAMIGLDRMRRYLLVGWSQWLELICRVNVDDSFPVAFFT